MLASQTNLAVEDRISWQNNNALTLASRVISRSAAPSLRKATMPA